MTVSTDIATKVHAATGTSVEDEAFGAGREAAAAALTGLQGAVPALIMMCASVRYDPHALLEGVRSVTGATPLVGVTSAGQFASGQYMPMASGVAVLAMTSGPYDFGIASTSNIGEDLVGAGRHLARESRAAVRPGGHGTMLLLADGLGVGSSQTLDPARTDHQRLVEGVYRVTGPRTPLVGGVAGDDLTGTGTHVFHDGAVLEHGAVAVWIRSERPLSVTTAHGWSPVGVPLVVSRSDSTRIVEIDGEPAARVYLRQVESVIGPLGTDQARFWDIGYHYPLGLLQPDQSFLIRVPDHVMEDGTIASHSPLPAGTALRVMTGSPDSLLEHAGLVAEKALRDRDDAGVLLAFSCAARPVVCGARIAEEPRFLQTARPDVPTFGFYTYGEFARTVGVMGLHNATISGVAL